METAVGEILEQRTDCNNCHLSEGVKDLSKSWVLIMNQEEPKRLNEDSVTDIPCRHRCIHVLDHLGTCALV